MHRTYCSGGRRPPVPTADPSRSLTLAVLLPAKVRCANGPARADLVFQLGVPLATTVRGEVEEIPDGGE
jgi:hypothetical protein